MGVMERHVNSPCQAVRLSFIHSAAPRSGRDEKPSTPDSRPEDNADDRAETTTEATMAPRRRFDWPVFIVINGEVSDEDGRRRSQRMPPMRQSVTASVRNCRRMSLDQGADGHAQPDLAGAFGHRHQHDVHDAHAADHQREERHDQQQRRHQRGRGGEGVGEFGHIADVEVVVLSLPDPMPLMQDRCDLAHGRVEVLCALGTPTRIESMLAKRLRIGC